MDMDSDFDIVVASMMAVFTAVEDLPFNNSLNFKRLMANNVDREDFYRAVIVFKEFIPQEQFELEEQFIHNLVAAAKEKDFDIEADVFRILLDIYKERAL